MMKPALASLSILTACAAVPTSAPVPTCGVVQWGPAGAPTWVTMGAAEPLTIFVDGASVPVAGAMVPPEGIVFRPAFPLEAGLRYRVRSKRGCEATFEVPAPVAHQREARAAAIYPQAEALPENILRFYVYFDQPMAEGNFLKYVRLTHVESGEDLSGVFFDNVYELWSGDRRRITLLVDPGRVKTGLLAHRRRGRAFKAGQTYALHIDAGWPTLAGRPLDHGTTKVFRAVAEDRRPVDPGQWRLRLPPAGTVQPLRIDFTEPVDHVLAAHFVSVVSSDGRRLAGRWQLDPGERTGVWIPRRPWAAPVDGHQLVIAGRFEDVAGNNVNAAFDHRAGTLPDGGEDRLVTVKFRDLQVSLP